MKLVYDINDKPPIKKNLVYAFQQLLAIMAATLLVPVLVNLSNKDQLPYLDQSAALLGAGFGTLFYILIATVKKSPVFLGSSFAFIAPLASACAFGYLGILLGALFAGLVYVVIALIIWKTGSAWVNKLLPAVVIGPTVALIGLSLCVSAMNNLMNIASDSTTNSVSVKEGYVMISEENLKDNVQIIPAEGEGEATVAFVENAKVVTAQNMSDATEVKTESTTGYGLIHIAVGLFAFAMTVWASVKGGKGLKLIPFIVGILSAYAVALVLTLIGNAANADALKIINLAAFDNLKLFQVPHFTFLGALGVGNEAGQVASDVKDFGAVLSVFMLFAPVAFVTLAEHIADHKNLSSIINRDLITEPGLHRTLIGDGVGSIVGSIFGGCPNTTYGESVGCVAITGNASVSTIIIAAIYCIVLAFFAPFAAFVNSIPTCITGGVCIALYGFIAVSGLKMLQPVDLGDNRNLFVVAVILVCGIGGLTINLGKITISATATALILGVLVNVVFNRRKQEEESK